MQSNHKWLHCVHAKTFLISKQTSVDQCRAIVITAREKILMRLYLFILQLMPGTGLVCHTG